MSRSSVEHVKNFNISFNIILLHNLRNSKLCQRYKSCDNGERNKPKIRSDKQTEEKWDLSSFWCEEKLTRTGFGPESIARLIERVIVDVDNVKGVPFVAKLFIAHLRAFLLLAEKSIATPMLLAPGIFACLQSGINKFRVPTFKIKAKSKTTCLMLKLKDGFKNKHTASPWVYICVWQQRTNFNQSKTYTRSRNRVID